MLGGKRFRQLKTLDALRGCGGFAPSYLRYSTCLRLVAQPFNSQILLFSKVCSDATRVKRHKIFNRPSSHCPGSDGRGIIQSTYIRSLVEFLIYRRLCNARSMDEF